LELKQQSRRGFCPYVRESSTVTAWPRESNAGTRTAPR